MASTISLNFRKHKHGTMGLKRHNERIPGQRHSNKKIKPERTKDNIFLKGDRELSYNERINKIIKKNVKSNKRVRHDAIRLVTAVVQFGGVEARKSSEEDKVKMLKSTYELLKTQFGEENIVSATIHVDETNPHLHFDFVPVHDGCLSAKKTLGERKGMFSIQDKFLEDMQNLYPDMDFQRKDDQTLNGLEQSVFEKLTKKADEYLHSKLDEISNIHSKLEIRRSQLDERLSGVITREKELDVREGSLNASEGKLKNAVDNFETYQKNKVKELKDKETQLNQRSTNLDIRQNEQDKTKDILNQRERELNQYLERVKNKEEEQEQKEKEIAYKQTFLKSKQLQQEQAFDKREDELARREQALTSQENTIKSTLSEFKTLINEQKLNLSTVEQYEKEVDKFTELFNFGLDDFTKVVNDLTKNNERGNSIER
jgi:hypothetical protein